jgi:lipoate-protein ligase B
LGKTKYGQALELQRQLVSLRQKEDVPEILLLVEHNHVITFGRVGRKEHLLTDANKLKAAGIEVFHIERGGDVTYHGPGQLIAYPIFDLNHWSKDLHLFLRNLEEVIIQTLREYDLQGERIKGLTGVWVDGKKAAAIGVAVKKWISLHGFALNVNTDLDYFRFIHPCGITDKPVTSIEELHRRKVSLEDVAEVMQDKLSVVFELNIKDGSKELLQQLISIGITSTK